MVWLLRGWLCSDARPCTFADERAGARHSCPVTAEAAGSSPVVPAILLNGLRIYRTCWLIHNQSTEPILRTDFVVVFSRIGIGRRERPYLNKGSIRRPPFHRSKAAGYFTVIDATNVRRTRGSRSSCWLASSICCLSLLFWTSLRKSAQHPSPPREVKRCLAVWEKFLHESTLPPLVTIALAHYQFEAIHRSLMAMAESTASSLPCS
jgi:hypothetical protein